MKEFLAFSRYGPTREECHRALASYLTLIQLLYSEQLCPAGQSVPGGWVQRWIRTWEKCVNQDVARGRERKRGEKPYLET